MMIMMMKFLLILILPLTLIVLLVPSKPMRPTFALNLRLNLILPKLGCHLKNGLAWMPPARLSEIVLMIRQGPLSWYTLNQNHSRLGYQIIPLFFDDRLSANLVKNPSSPKLIFLRSLLMIFSLLTSMMFHLLETILIPTCLCRKTIIHVLLRTPMICASSILQI
jgi:hypothetical protein